MIFVVAAVVILGGGSLIALGLRGDGGGSGGGLLPSSLTLGDESPTPSASPSPTGPTPEELAAAARAKQVKALDKALKKLDADSPEFSVAVLDKTTGQKYAYRGTEKYETASIVKVQVMACMLLEAQEKDREPTAGEMDLAKPMIRLSDNNATTSLFTHLGGRTAINACNAKLGLTQTTVSSSWGLTKTTVDDQVKLLGELVDTKGPLDAGSRKTAFGLMNSVDETQTWGVPAAGRTGETTTVKNGWLSRSTDNNLWIINTVGRITGDDDTNVSIAVLSHNNATMDSGITLVEKVAKLTRTYLKY
ncbi:serine hydrolase [Actinoplanes sp. RD1]|uniref:serine hydrolase n=1 Tax=Actinoplanes sp. RD1 TaxID=3064538 RepID=UPI002740477E|nr:serine hydrolase [Actinoplanes sp. RD1]